MKMKNQISESLPPPKKMKIQELQTDEKTLIPDDVILLQILPRLPIKSALRFQLVSKPWRNFIKHPFFTRLHLSVAKSRNPTTFLILSTHRPSRQRPPIENPNSIIDVVSIDVDRNNKSIQNERIEYAPVQEFIGVVGCVGHVIGVCCGVFCLSYGAFAALLWNPAIGEVKIVRFSYRQLLQRNYFNYEGMCCIGFGDVKDDFGNVVNFKLLTMVRNNDRKPSLLFSVYSLNTGKWVFVESPSFEVEWVAERGWVCFKGVVYWLAWGRDTKNSAFLLTFDIASETFGRIEFPRGDELIVVKEWDNFLTVFDDQYMLLTVATSEAWRRCFNIWALFEDGNKKQWVRTDKVIKIKPLNIKRGSMLGYWAGGNAVISLNNRTLCLHDADDKCSTYEIKLPGDVTCWEYSESLVSLKRISDQDNFQDID